MGLRSIEVKCKLPYLNQDSLSYKHYAFYNVPKWFILLKTNLFKIVDGPTMIVYPQTTSGDKMSAVMLFCVVDSNPPPKYHWTKGNSREVSSLA